MPGKMRAEWPKGVLGQSPMFGRVSSRCLPAAARSLVTGSGPSGRSFNRPRPLPRRPAAPKPTAESNLAVPPPEGQLAQPPPPAPLTLGDTSAGVGKTVVHWMGAGAGVSLGFIAVGVLAKIIGFEAGEGGDGPSSPQ